MTGKEEMIVRDKKQNKKTVLFSLLAAVFTLIALSALPVQAADSFFVYTNPQTGKSFDGLGKRIESAHYDTEYSSYILRIVVP